jgi:hypothetical protein
MALGKRSKMEVKLLFCAIGSLSSVALKKYIFKN